METKESLIEKPKTKFIKAKCKSCKGEQVIFSAASTAVNCNVCHKPLAVPKASRASIEGQIVKEFK